MPRRSSKKIAVNTRLEPRYFLALEAVAERHDMRTGTVARMILEDAAARELAGRPDRWTPAENLNRQAAEIMTTNLKE